VLKCLPFPVCVALFMSSIQAREQKALEKDKLTSAPLEQAFLQQLARSGVPSSALSDTANVSRTLGRSSSNASAEERENERISRAVEAVSGEPSHTRAPCTLFAMQRELIMAGVLCLL
jgi:hypothetical protein